MSPNNNQERLDDILDRSTEDREKIASGSEEPLFKKTSSSESREWWPIAFVLSLVWCPVYGLIVAVLSFPPFRDLLFLPIFGNEMIRVFGGYLIGVLIICLVLYKIDKDSE